MSRNRVFMNEPRYTPEERKLVDWLDAKLGIGPLHGTNIGKRFEREAKKEQRKLRRTSPTGKRRSA